MTEAAAKAAETPSLWSGWGDATELQRSYFNTLPHHRAWSRVCGGCGEGDFLERKQKPTGNAQGLSGHGFPPLPEPVVEGGKPGAKRRRFRTPPGRVHSCVPAARP